MRSLQERDRSEGLVNGWWLAWGLLFGCLGLGFFVYGRKQQRPVPLLCGIALMVFPYFVSNLVLLVAIGIALLALPYFVKV